MAGTKVMQVRAVKRNIPFPKPVSPEPVEGRCPQYSPNYNPGTISSTTQPVRHTANTPLDEFRANGIGAGQAHATGKFHTPHQLQITPPKKLPQSPELCERKGSFLAKIWDFYTMR